ncbi:helix-turn-helix domain-containing protein [Vibrio chagasii]|uniref:Helix-turn-helix domain-containing protein n=1 Tax=Vibrio chagasii TaxID=170679 RepID=A0A7Y3YSJ7_9VIBR|nr:helix-turn-helix transcriptional regulator [Vibrio chagasii]NOH35601.1 helix-turn-helix domain-containing protein [Vibrio chagasii]
MRKTSLIVSVLRRFRDLAGLTQKQMSAKTGISLATIKRIERGARSMTIEDYESYLEVLELSHMDVLIAMDTGNYNVEREIASLARKLPEDLKEAHLSYLVALTKAL